MKVLVINGPNLNLVGTRKTEVYGNESLSDYLISLQSKYDFEVCQSNVEGELINRLQKADTENYKGILINAGGYTHTSVAISDCIEAIETPVIEIHISNIFDREDFSNKSLISKNCTGHITGFGLKSYELGLKALFS